MRNASIEDTPLGLTHEEIQTVFQPFVSREVEAEDPEWRQHLRIRKKRIVKKGLRRILVGWLPRMQRREGGVVREYSEVWSRTPWGQYSLVATPPRFSPWEWRGRRMLASNFGATRFRQLILVRLLEHVKPRSVLEVGCGNGINLMLLAGRFPDVAFAGIDLTEAGHQSALAFQQQETLPREMQDYAPLPTIDPTAFRRIRFHQGSATALPFEDGSFDLVITVLALEQMERIRTAALGEIARVAGRHTFMIEPFHDVNRKGWTRLNVLRRDYFRGSIGDLPSYGLEPVLITDDFPHETFLHVCAVLSEKTGPRRA